MIKFAYTLDERTEILRVVPELPSMPIAIANRMALKFNISICVSDSGTDDPKQRQQRRVEGLEAAASIYLTRLASNPESLRKKLEAVHTTLGLLTQDTDETHRERLRIELARLERDIWFVERPRQRRARRAFIIAAMDFWRSHAGEPLLEGLKLSDSGSVFRQFLEAAIGPVLLKSGEPIEIRQLITIVGDIQEEQRVAEISAMTGYEMKREKNWL